MQNWPCLASEAEPWINVASGAAPSKPEADLFCGCGSLRTFVQMQKLCDWQSGKAAPPGLILAHRLRYSALSSWMMSLPPQVSVQRCRDSTASVDGRHSLMPPRHGKGRSEGRILGVGERT